MEDNFSSIVEYCDSCNQSFEPWNIRQYKVLYQGSKIHDQDKITLCNVCSKIAKYAEQLINNIQGNSLITPEVQLQKKPIKNLSIFNLGTLQLSDNDDTKPSYSVISAKNGQILTEDFKIFVKVEVNLYDDANSHGKEINETNIKQEYLNEEDNTPPKDLKEIESKEEKKRERKTRRSETDNSKKTDLIKEKLNKEKQIKIPIIHLTTEQFMQEKLERSKTEKYLNSQYKCADCVVGFFHEENYLKHMEKHSESAGQFECELCKLRMNAKRKLQDHLKLHIYRYKCTHCNLIRNQLRTIREHLYFVHKIGIAPKMKCNICSLVLSNKTSLHSHMKSKHKPRDKVPCNHCPKIYSTLESLKNHMLLAHPEELKVKQENRHVCQECGAGFRTAAFLRRHQLKHSDRKDHYCVECDKSFKTETALKTHLTTTATHVSNSELPWPCTHCEKRFSLRCNLERHTNAVHLNLTPYQCDQCSKSFSSARTLNNHKKITHEGYKTPRKFKCEFCDKAFTEKSILKAHIRTHTGERPYQCDKCEATFGHHASLYTHNKLVHLKLKRNRKQR